MRPLYACTFTRVRSIRLVGNNNNKKVLYVYDYATNKKKINKKNMVMFLPVVVYGCWTCEEAVPRIQKSMRFNHEHVLFMLK